MSVLSAHDLTRTVFCKVDGCPDEAAARTGVYALLCRRHADDRRRANAAAPRPERLRVVRADALEPLARQLVDLARAVDRVRARHEAARRKMQPLEDELAQALQAWRTALAQLR